MCRSAIVVAACLGLVAAVVWCCRGTPPDTEAADAEFRPVAETRVNTFTASSQSHSCIATGIDGTTVVVWDSRRQQHGTYGIYMQRFASDGTRLGPEQQVNLHQRNMQMNPAVAFDGTGGIWVAWESFGQDGSMNAIIARRFDLTGTDGGDEILVNQTTAGHQRQVVVTGHRDGSATCIWTTPPTNENPQRILMRTFDSAGLPIIDETPGAARRCSR